MSDEGIVDFKIKVAGNAIPDTYQVNSFEVQQQVNSIGYATLTLTDPCDENKEFPVSSSDNFIPGKAISIELGYGTEAETIFKGIVVSQSVHLDSASGTRLVVQCQDVAVLMVASRKNATFLKSKDSAAITTILGNYSGLTADVTATDNELPVLQQFNSTDWDFVVTRAEANGLIVINENGKLSVVKPDADTSSVLTIKADDNLLEFNGDLNALGQASSVKASAWDPSSQAMINSEVQDSASGPGNLTGKKVAEDFGATDPSLITTSCATSDDLKAWAQARVVKNTYSKINGMALCKGTSKVHVGKYVTIAGMGSRFNGDHIISTVCHTFEEGTWLTRIELGLPSNWFSEMRPDVSSPAASASIPAIKGLCNATVKKINDDPDSEFRVQISIPTFNTDDSGIWARLVQDYATDGAGLFFYPEVGDEVVVGFLNEDPRYPIILGSVYSSKHKPQSDYTPDDKNSKKAIVSKSNIQIQFDDENKIATVKTPGDNSLTLDDKNKKVTIKDQNGNSIEMSDSGITIKSSKDINLESDQSISIKGKQGITQESSGGDVTIKGMNVKQNADTQLSLESSATASLQGGSELTLKGAMVMIN